MSAFRRVSGALHVPTRPGAATLRAVWSGWVRQDTDQCPVRVNVSREVYPFFNGYCLSLSLYINVYSRNSYWGVFWIDTSTSDSIGRGLLRIAPLL
jgi:hypothetical protein